MPLPPDIDVYDPNNPYTTLGNNSYSAPTEFMNDFESMLSNNVINKMLNKYEADPNLTMLHQFDFSPQVQDYIDETIARKPASDDAIKEAQSERGADFNVPRGTSEVGLELLKKNYDQQSLYNYIAERPATAFGSLAGFGGTVAAGFFDPVSLATGGLAAGAVSRITSPLASDLMTSLAVKETMGSKVAQVATNMAQNALLGGAGMGGYQAAGEIAEQGERKSFKQPTDWISSLQRVGSAVGLGALLGGAGTGLGIGLFGYEKPIIANDTGETVGYERTGGLFNSDAFQDASQKMKDSLSRWMPWSQDADITAREDAMGQALNGQDPNVSIILKQGAIDEGVRFQDYLKENNLDLKDVDSRLIAADDETNNLIKKLADTRDALQESDKQLAEHENVGITGNNDISQRGLINRFKASQFDQNVIQSSNEVIPYQAAKFLNIQNQIDDLNRRLEDETISNTQRKSAQQNLNKLQKAQKKLKILTPREELRDIKKRLIDKGLPDNFQQTTDYLRLKDLSKFWGQARDLLDRVHLERDHQMQVRDLLSRKVIIKSMRDHINADHPPVTDQEVKQYANHINSSGLDDVPISLPEAMDTTIDQQLEQFTPEAIQEILDVAPEFKDEIEAVVQKREQLPTFKQMAKDLVTCMMRNEV